MHKNLKTRNIFFLRLILLILPLMLLAFFTLFLTTIVFYFDGKEESLAAKAENIFLAFALRNSRVPVVQSDKLISVSVQDSDFKLLRRSMETPLNEAHLLEYAEILRQVLKRNPQLVVVSVLAQAHYSDETYFAALFNVVKEFAAQNKVVFAFPRFLFSQFSQTLRREFIFRDAIDCRTLISLVCPLGPDSILNYLVRKFAIVPEKVITRNLSSEDDSIVMRLPTLKENQKFSFYDLKEEPQTRQIPDGALVFIGNSMRQDFLFRDNLTLLQRNFIAIDNSSQSLMIDGETWHEQWARVAQMLIDGTEVRVASARLETGFVLWLIMLVFVTAWKWQSRAFASFFLGSVLLPFGNILGIKYFSVYVPIVNMVFWGTISFVLLSFGSMTYNAILKRVVKFRKQRGDFHADIKQNFLSIISHNVNTPIAQIKGLFDAFFNAEDLRFKSIGKNIELMNLAAKITLASSRAVATSASSCSLETIIKIFLERYSVFFERLDIDTIVTLNQGSSTDGERLYCEEDNLAIVLLCAIFVLTQNCEGLVEVKFHKSGFDLFCSFDFKAIAKNQSEDFLIKAAEHLLSEYQKAGRIYGITSLNLTSVQPSISFPNLFLRGENSALRIESSTL